MRLELEADGYPVQVLAINKIDAETTQESLVSKTAFPLFQDTLEVQAWSLHDGSKDDFFVYGPDGLLYTYLPHGGEIDTNLSTDEGYNNLKDAILDLF
jgi:hypothetical protein